MKKQIIPLWVKNAVFYEIYPQTFLDTTGNGIGDLAGIRKKLKYVSDLGVTAIWLNPFYLSPMRDAGYDVSDYRMVDPRYGTMEDFTSLVEEAKELGLRIIIDLVPGHTSIDHPWFKESAKENAMRPFKNWYIWTESAWDNGGEKYSQKMIHGYGERNGNFLINFFYSQPALNFGFANPTLPWQLPTTHPDVVALWREMKSIIRFWMEKGVSGFRVDMADSLIRNDEGHKEIRRFWKEVREETEKDFPDFFIIAEGHPSNVLDGNGFHSAYLHWAKGYWSLFRQGETISQTGEVSKVDAYFSKDGNGSTKEYMDTFLSEYKQTEGKGVITVPVGNHDLPRIAVGQSTCDLEVIFAFQASFPGIPFIYYGDEIGMRQTEDSPYSEGCYPTRNGGRTPMQWDSSKNMGFSVAHPKKLYLSIDEEANAPTVEKSQNDTDGLIHRVRKLNEIHKKEKAFGADMPFKLLSNGDGQTPLSFIREEGKRKVLCVFYPTHKDAVFNCKEYNISVVKNEIYSKNTTKEGEIIKLKGPAFGFFEIE